MNPDVPEEDGPGLAEPVARYGNPKHKVGFGPGAFSVGVLVAHLTFSLLFGIAGGGNLIPLVLLYGIIPAIATALVLGLPTGLLMRDVPNQWLHVLAFFGAGALAGAIWGGLGGASFLFALLLGVSAAIGRLSVWKAVQINV
jgi:hypothetical protein